VLTGQHRGNAVANNNDDEKPKDPPSKPPQDENPGREVRDGSAIIRKKSD
jgi:hypothetical protein